MGDELEQEPIPLPGLPADLAEVLFGLLYRQAGDPTRALDSLCERYPEHREAIGMHAEFVASMGQDLDAVRHPRQVGPFRIIDVLGEGGMGTVYHAEQDLPVRRTVALKVVKRGLVSLEILARFEAERQALALMTHPNIARVFESGQTAEGQPYFAMELIRGTPITTFCEARGVGLEQRLRLLIAACRGVHHAHQKGVIHRDVKPSNILVEIQDDRPTPRLIDFGVAKAIHDGTVRQPLHTSDGRVLGTPEYMAPEQAAGASRFVDTRSDVYSLGVVLFELLTGVLPRQQVKRSSAEGSLEPFADTPRPSTRVRVGSAFGKPKGDAARRTRLRRAIAGDLDAITLTALAPEPDRRYQTPGDFADDLERHLANLPVRARRPSTVYRVRKLFRRQAAMCGSALVLASCAAVVGVFAWRSAAIERRQHEEQALTVRAALNEATLERAQARATPVETADVHWHAAASAIGRARTILAAPSGPAELTGEVQQLGREIERERATNAAERSRRDLHRRQLVEFRRVGLAPGSRMQRSDQVVAWLDDHYAEVMRRHGIALDGSSPEDVAALFRGASTAEFVDEFDLWAACRWFRGDKAGAQRCFAVARALGPEDAARETVRALFAGEDIDEHRLAGVTAEWRESGLVPGAALLFSIALRRTHQEGLAVAMLEEAWVHNPRDLRLHTHLGRLFLVDHDFDRAYRHYSALAAIAPDLAWFGLGYCHFESGQIPWAIEALRRCIEVDPEDPWAHNNLGYYLLEAHDEESALREFRATIELWPEHPLATANVAWALVRLKRYEEAIPVCQQAIEIAPKEGDPRQFLGVALTMTGDVEGGQRAFEEAVARNPKEYRVRAPQAATLLKVKREDLRMEAMRRGVQSLERCPVESEEDIGAAYYLSISLALAHLRRKAATDEAVEAAQMAAELRPDAIQPRALLVAFRSQRDEAGECDRAVAALLETADRMPSREGHYSASTALAQAHRYVSAADQGRKALAFAPDDPKVALGWARAMRAAGCIDEAIEMARADAERLNSGMWYNLLGQLLLSRRTYADRLDSVGAMRRAVDIEPLSLDYRCGLGDALRTAWRPEEAAAQFREVIAREPDHAKGLCGLGLALQDIGQLAEARAYLGRGHEIGSREPSWKLDSGALLVKLDHLIGKEPRSLSLLAAPDQDAPPHERQDAVSSGARLRRHAEVERVIQKLLSDLPDVATERVAIFLSIADASCRAAMDSALSEQQRAVFALRTHERLRRMLDEIRSIPRDTPAAATAERLRLSVLGSSPLSGPLEMPEALDPPRAAQWRQLRAAFEELAPAVADGEKDRE
ncbi:MAG: protein kinase [Planctomycetes bacterium]|nr:protein kinase [Planctomycetota bacterium]